MENPQNYPIFHDFDCFSIEKVLVEQFIRYLLKTFKNSLLTILTAVDFNWKNWRYSKLSNFSTTDFYFFFLNFYVSILLELEVNLAQLLLPTYFKPILDLRIELPSLFFPGIKLPGFFFPVILGIKLPGLFFPRSNLGLVQVSAFKFTCILN